MILYNFMRFVKVCDIKHEKKFFVAKLKICDILYKQRNYL